MLDAVTSVGWLFGFAALMASLSIAVERVVEIIKGAVPPLAKPWTKYDVARRAILQMLAAGVGTFAASQVPDQIKSAMTDGRGDQLRWQGYALIGLIVSGGAGVWNHVLDILGALKTKEEKSAATSVPSDVRTVGSAGNTAPKVEAAAVQQTPTMTTSVKTGGERRSPALSVSSVPPAPPSYSGRVVSIGETDARVIQLIQNRLNQVGCGPIAEDGVFGPNTQAAVELFQMRCADHFGLPLRVDGKVGPLTWASLFAVPQVPTVDTVSSPLRAATMKIAAGEVGVREVPLGSNRGPRVDQYLRAVGIDPATGSYPWCAAFVYWCFQQAASSLQIANPVIRTASVADHWSKAPLAGILCVTTAECNSNPALVTPGMIFVMMSSGETGHTGLIEQVTGTYLTTIEGNTNDNGSREGIGVFRRNKRIIADINRGFICY